MGGSDTLAYCVYGSYQRSHNYPNTMFFLGALEKSNRFELADQSGEIQNGIRLYTGKNRFLTSVKKAILLFLNSLQAAFKVYRARLSKNPNFIYVPYPAIFTLFFLAMLPGRRVPPHPPVIADAFISLYDTIVNDRQLVKKDGLFAKLLFLVERKALTTPEVVMVDTQANAEFMTTLFKPQKTIFHAEPLCIDEKLFVGIRDKAKLRQGQCLFLFTGSFVPLQGVETIVEAAILLQDREDIIIRLVGDGQTADAVEKLIHSSHVSNISWHHGWQNAQTLIEEYRKADVCLGIFGRSDKALRVWPYKNYQAMAAGKPIITLTTRVLNEFCPKVDFYYGVPAGDAQGLAEAIRLLADDVPMRNKLGANSAVTFDTFLSQQAVEEHFYNMVMNLTKSHSESNGTAVS